MPTSDQRDAIRYDLDAPDLTDPEIDALYARVAVTYPDNSPAQDAGVRVLVINSLLSQSARLVDYKANRSEEKMSQIFSNLLRLRTLYLDDLSIAVNTALDGVMFGQLRRVDARIEEYPVMDSDGSIYIAEK